MLNAAVKDAINAISKSLGVKNILVTYSVAEKLFDAYKLARDMTTFSKYFNAYKNLDWYLTYEFDYLKHFEISKYAYNLVANEAYEALKNNAGFYEKIVAGLEDNIMFIIRKAQERKHS